MKVKELHNILGYLMDKEQWADADILMVIPECTEPGMQLQTELKFESGVSVERIGAEFKDIAGSRYAKVLIMATPKVRSSDVPLIRPSDHTGSEGS